MAVAADRLRMPVLEAHDVDGAHEHICTVYIPHRLVPRDGSAMDFKMAYFATPRLTFGHVTYGADAELLCPEMGSFYHLNLTLSGHTRVTQAGRQAVTTGRQVGAVFNPADPYRVRWSRDAVQYALRLPARALQEQLALLLGSPGAPLVFDLTFDMTDERGRSLLSAVNHLRTQYGTMNARGVGARAVISQLESYVLTQVLLTTRHNYSTALNDETRTASRQHVCRAVELIEERAADPWTVETLAREVCVSARALQIGFRKELQVTPMEYLREVRLRRVRDELLGSPASVQVSEVATRWGFFHLGRFSHLYRERFGVLPSESVRRYVAR
ncbi:AraC family transcriptional regulator [Nocardioides sp. AN3]